MSTKIHLPKAPKHYHEPSTESEPQSRDALIPISRALLETWPTQDLITKCDLTAYPGLDAGHLVTWTIFDIIAKFGVI
jgi:hypothetical protein